MTTETEHFDGNDDHLIARKLVELQKVLEADESVGWNLWEDPELPERLGREVARQMQHRGYVVYAEGEGTVNISRKR